jgi:hypothetical protein
MIHEEFNNDQLDRYTLDHTQRELSSLTSDFEIELRRSRSVIEATDTYVTVLRNVLEGSDLSVKVMEVKGRSMLLKITSCDFREACPRVSGCMCLRGMYIRDALEVLGPIRSGVVEFQGEFLDDCKVTLELDIDKEKVKEGANGINGVEYLNSLEQKIRSIPRDKRNIAHMAHFLKGTLASARNVLSTDQFKEFKKLLSMHMGLERDSSQSQSGPGDILRKDHAHGLSNRGGQQGNIISCPKCGTFINLDRSRSCYSCGLVFNRKK